MTTASVALSSMKVAQIPRPGAEYQIVEREIPKPTAGHVRIRVQACGVCHSDVFVKEGSWPGIQYPRVPGHEVAGVIDEVGAGVTTWKSGQRVGVGWHGGQDGTCPQCRRGDFGHCQNLKVAGISYDGGYQQYMLAPVEALVAIPDGLDAPEAAPLLCAGVTTYNALRHSGALPGDLVAVQGIGGLGHLGLQFASKSGYRVAAIGRGSENAQIAKQLGASAYIDSPRKRPRRAHGGRGACPTPFSLVRCVSLSVTRREAADRRGPGVSQAAASRRPSAGSSGPVSGLGAEVTREAAALRAGRESPPAIG